MISLRGYEFSGDTTMGCCVFFSAVVSPPELCSVGLSQDCDINLEHLVRVVSARFLHGEVTVINKEFAG